MTHPTEATIGVRYEYVDQAGKWQGTSSGFGKLAQATQGGIATVIANINGHGAQRNPQIELRLTLAIPVANIDEAKRLAEADWVPRNVAEPEPMIAQIPGSMRAVYKDGKIERLWFSPAAGDAGYQDSSFFVESGDTGPDEEDDRPFWAAVGEFLYQSGLDPENNPQIGWEG